MKNNPIISIIVPVYNVEKYLPFCLKSIQNQTFTDFECILINDGSTDSSGIICDNISKEDSRFKVIHQENQGEAFARNQGLSQTFGNFIYFVDSDDYIHPQILEVLYNSLIYHKVSFSMILGKRVFSYDEANFKQESMSVIMKQDELIKRLFGNSNEELQYQVLWNKLYPKELIENIRLKKTASEDTDFNLQVFLQSESAILINTEMYYWMQHSTSITHSGINKRFVYILDSYYDMYQSIPPQNEIYRAYCIYKLYKRILNTRYYANMTEQKKYAKDLTKKIKERTWSDFWNNKYLKLSQKITISCLYYFPFLYTIFMKLMEHKAKS